LSLQEVLLLVLAFNAYAASATILVVRKRRFEEATTIASSLLSLAVSLSLLASQTGVVELSLVPFISLMLDKLSLMFSTVVSLIGFFVSVYSVEYMRGDEEYQKYYSLITLFIGSMLNLVLASDIVYLLLNWELVGVCSALLISHWWRRPEARRAGVKALAMTRFSDIGLLAFASIAVYYNSTSIPSTLASGNMVERLASYAPLLVLAAIGKSAQFPLHTWLPDAMEGPTTVSALLHAATMVKAGVYLALRFYPLIHASALAVNGLLALSLATILISGLAGLASMDLKRILAFNTISSLSLMFLSISLGETGLAILYLFNHAVFKSLLFLTTGKIEHTLHTRDISRLRSLWARGFRVETVGFLIGALSAAGLPPLTAGLIKEEIYSGLETYVGSPIYHLMTGGLSLLLSLFIMRPFVIAFLGRRGGNSEMSVERTPLMTGVNLSLALLTLIAFPPTLMLATYFGTVFEPALRLAALIGVLSGILLSLSLPYLNLRVGNRFRGLLESSFGMDVLYMWLGEHASATLSKLASALNRGRASQGVVGLVAVTVILVALAMVVSP